MAVISLEQPVWSADRQTLSNVLVDNLLVTYNVTDTWYDGTPMDASKVDDDLVYIFYEGRYLVQNNAEGRVLEIDSIANLKNISDKNILLLNTGYYKNVKLLGYISEGDAPEVVYYWDKDSTLTDDGGSVISINSLQEGRFILKNLTNIDIRNFGVLGTNVISDTLQTNRAILASKGSVIFGDSGTELVLGSINVKKDNIELIANGATIKNQNELGGYTLFNIFKDAKPDINYATQSPLSITKGQYKISNSQLSLNCAKGDILIIEGGVRYTDAVSGGVYNHGTYTEVLDIQGTDVYIKQPPMTTYTSTRVRVFPAIRNFRMTGFKLRLDQSTTAGGIQLRHAIDSEIYMNDLESVNSIIGIAMVGINLKTDLNNVRGFNNNLVDSTGYGISAAGHNISITKNNVFKGKHCITASSRNFISTNINYIENTCYSDKIATNNNDRVAVVDIHGNTIGGSISYNTLIGTEEVASGILMRSAQIDMIGNKIYLRKNNEINRAVYGIYNYELFEGNCKIQDNQFNIYNENGSVIPILLGLQNTTTQINNVSINGNYFNQGINRIEGNIGVGIDFYENNFDAELDETFSNIQLATVPLKVRIFRNKFRNRTSSQSNSLDMTSGGIYDTTNKKIDIEVFDNDVFAEKLALSGRFLFRSIYGKCYNNRLRTATSGNVTTLLINDVSTTKENYKFDNQRISTVNGEIQQLHYLEGALPTPSEFFINKDISTSNNDTGQNIKYYKCKKVNSAYSWSEIVLN